MNYQLSSCGLLLKRMTVLVSIPVHFLSQFQAYTTLACQIQSQSLDLLLALVAVDFTVLAIGQLVEQDQHMHITSNLARSQVVHYSYFV